MMIRKGTAATVNIIKHNTVATFLLNGLISNSRAMVSSKTLITILV